jgi:hypothetical protein
MSARVPVRAVAPSWEFGLPRAGDGPRRDRNNRTTCRVVSISADADNRYDFLRKWFCGNDFGKPYNDSYAVSALQGRGRPSLPRAGAALIPPAITG